jgi:hypothetical protein
VPVLPDIVVIFFKPTIVLIPNGSFGVVPPLRSVSNLHVTTLWTKINTLPAAPYGRGNLYVALKRGHGSRVFEKKVLKGEFALNTEEVI